MSSLKPGRFTVMSPEFGRLNSKSLYLKRRTWRFKFRISLLLLALASGSLSPFSPLFPQTDPASEWNLLYPMIRDRLILKEEARRQLKALEGRLKDQYSKNLIIDEGDGLCFPLKGYTFHSIGGRGGSGYRIEGYDFFDGSEHQGHPGHDIFMRDRDQDCLDDATGKPVGVLAAAAGVVVSVNLGWEPSSQIRGGNYVWICDPVKARYYYYAHLDQVFVKVGQIVPRGERLGTVGRTGLNAYPKRSPTHLHFTTHQSVEGYPKPTNPYNELVKGYPR